VELSHFATLNIYYYYKKVPPEGAGGHL